jgi:hypothetical protein
MRTEELLALGMFSGRSRLRERIEMLLEHGRDFSPRASMSRVAASAVALVGCMIAGGLAPRVIAFAQQPAFEVASVKPNKSAGPGAMIPPVVGGRFTATNVSAQELVITAYRVQGFQVSGGPGWLGTDRFDIEAKAAGNAARDQISLMIQSLLADRFKLALHRESKELPV